MEPLDLAIQLSDLFETAEAEGGTVAKLIDEQIIPHLATDLKEADGVGIGQRFSKLLDQVRTTIGQIGGDPTRALKEMMKKVLSNYVKLTNDTLSARHIFSNAIMQGKDTMLTVTAAGLLANVLAGQHPRQAMQLMQHIGTRMSGEAPAAQMECSAGAVGAGAIATTPGKIATKRGKNRKESIFAEWNDLLGEPDTLTAVREIAEGIENRLVQGVLVDPTTAELVLATHIALSPDRQRRFEAKPISEMIRIAHRLFEQGAIQIIMEEDS